MELLASGSSLVPLCHLLSCPGWALSYHPALHPPWQPGCVGDGGPGPGSELPVAPKIRERPSCLYYLAAPLRGPGALRGEPVTYPRSRH